MSAVYNLTNPNTLLLTRLLKQKMKIKFTSFQSEVYFLNLFLKFDYSSHNVHIKYDSYKNNSVCLFKRNIQCNEEDQTSVNVSLKKVI